MHGKGREPEGKIVEKKLGMEVATWPAGNDSFNPSRSSHSAGEVAVSCRGTGGMPRTPDAYGTATTHCPACESSLDRGRVTADSPICRGKIQVQVEQEGGERNWGQGSASSERMVPPDRRGSQEWLGGGVTVGSGGECSSSRLLPRGQRLPFQPVQQGSLPLQPHQEALWARLGHTPFSASLEQGCGTGCRSPLAALQLHESVFPPKQPQAQFSPGCRSGICGPTSECPTRAPTWLLTGRAGSQEYQQ